MASRIVEATFMLIMAYLVIANADAFGVAIRSIAGAYTSAVQTLQGR